MGNTNALTNSVGQIVGTYTYSSFGSILLETGSATNTFKFVGQWGVSAESNGLDYMRARFSNQTLGRFIQSDPIGIAGGVNTYNYVANIPTMAIDPSGLWFQGADGNVKWQTLMKEPMHFPLILFSSVDPPQFAANLGVERVCRG